MARFDEVARVRVVATRDGEMDTMAVTFESPADTPEAYAAAVQDVLKLRGSIEIVPVGSLPNDGIVIEDARDYET